MTPPRGPALLEALHAALMLGAALSFAFLQLDLQAGSDPPRPTPGLLPILGLAACVIGLNAVQARCAGGRLALPVLVIALVAADLSRLTGLWPCDVGCQGGAYYQTLAGISIVWPALAAHLGLAGLVLRDAQRGGSCAWTRRALGFLAGVSLFFIVISGTLGLHCPYCSVVHWTTLFAWNWALTTGLASAGVRWWHHACWLLAGWLVTNAVFHHAPVADAGVPPSGSTPTVTRPAAGDAALLARIDAGRTRGRSDAPATLELALNLHCETCTRLHAPLLAALAQPLAEGRVKVVIRLVVRPSQPVGADAARLVLAAAATGEHEAALATLLDSNPQAQPEGLRARLAEAIAIAPVDAVLRDHAALLDRVLAGDAARLLALKTGNRTPTAVLLRDGREAGRWSGDFAPAAVVDALGR